MRKILRGVTFFSLVIFLAVIFFRLSLPRPVKVEKTDLIVELMKETKPLEIPLDNVEIDDNNDLTAHIGKTDILVIFSTKKPLKDQLISLQKLLKSSTIGTSTKKIDLRFNKIVIN